MFADTISEHHEPRSSLSLLGRCHSCSYSKLYALNAGLSKRDANYRLPISSCSPPVSPGLRPYPPPPRTHTNLHRPHGCNTFALLLHHTRPPSKSLFFHTTHHTLWYMALSGKGQMAPNSQGPSIPGYTPNTGKHQNRIRVCLCRSIFPT